MRKAPLVTGSLLGVFFLFLGAGCALRHSLLLKPPAPKGRDFVLYRIRAGDTLSAIGERFGASAESIANINRISDPNGIQANQRIWVPRNTFVFNWRWRQPGVYVRTQSGDTVSGLAAKHGGRVDDIVDFNRILVSDRLTPGQLVFIPLGRSLPVAPVPVVEKPQKSTGKLIWPLDQGTFKISSEFGARSSGPHKGLDLTAPRGTPIHAADAGVVIVASDDVRGYGKTVVLRHPSGLRTVYAHADSLFVEMGQQVTQGQKIAEVGATGRSTGYHLHFEVRPTPEKIDDPLKYLPPLQAGK